MLSNQPIITVWHALPRQLSVEAQCHNRIPQEGKTGSQLSKKQVLKRLAVTALALCRSGRSGLSAADSCDILHIAEDPCQVKSPGHPRGALTNWHALALQCRSVKFAALVTYGKASETSLTLRKIPAWRSSTTSRDLMVMAD